MSHATIARYFHLVPAAALAVLLVACGDKDADADTAAAGKTGSRNTNVLVKVVPDDTNSDESSCWFGFTATNQTRDKLTIMASFDAVHAVSGEPLEVGDGLETVIFSGVEAGSTQNSLTPAYVNATCDVLKLNLQKFYCLGDDCDPVLSAESIAAIGDTRGG